MSLISTSTLSGSSVSGLTSTTSSTIVLSDILTGAVIALGALFFLLVLNYLMSAHDSWNANTAAALRAISVPLFVTFCAFVVFNAAHIL
jgi:hypothetical protein